MAILDIRCLLRHMKGPLGCKASSRKLQRHQGHWRLVPNVAHVDDDGASAGETILIVASLHGRRQDPVYLLPGVSNTPYM